MCLINDYEKNPQIYDEFLGKLFEMLIKIVR